MLTGFNEGRILFGRYLEQSLKNKMRQKRAETSAEYEVHPEMILSMSLNLPRQKAVCLLISVAVLLAV